MRSIIGSRWAGAVLILCAAAGSITAAGLSSAPALAATSPVTGVGLSWGLDSAATAGAFFGGCNFLSAGTAGDTGSSRVWTQADGFFAAEAGNVTIEKPSATWTLSEPTWADKCTASDGTTTLTPSTSSGTTVDFAGGTGSVDVGAGTASVHWIGSFTSAFYGGLVYWSAADPTLTVNADGTGTLRANVSGYGASMSDPTAWSTLNVRTVTLATLTGVAVTATGITTSPVYAGVPVKAPAGAAAQDITSAGWGSWPQDFVDFQGLTGEGSYWYSSGSGDALKAPAPLHVSYVAAADTTPTPTPSTTETPSPTASASPSASASGTASSATTPTPSATVTPTSAASCTLSAGVQGGSLTWGFKKSFRSYVISGGAANHINASGGATVLNQDLAVAGNAASGTFLWPFSSGIAYTSPAAFTSQYSGSVDFSYPAHYFDVVIANPKVTVSGTAGTLYADVTLTSSEPGKATVNKQPGVALASIDLTGSSATTSASSVTRTVHTAIQDTDAFALDGSDFYQKGDVLDDAAIVLTGCAAADTGGGAASAGTTAGSVAAAVSASASASASSDPDLVPTAVFRPATGALASTGADTADLAAAGLLAVIAGAWLVVIGDTNRMNTLSERKSR